MTYFIPGMVAQITVTFYDPDGNPADPDAVTLLIQDTHMQTSTPAATRTGTGVYEYALALPRPGSYRVRLTGTGSIPTAAETTILVNESNIDWQVVG